MKNNPKDYMLSYDSESDIVYLYGKPIGGLQSDMVRKIWQSVQSFDYRIDIDGKPLVHGSLWQHAIVKVKDTKRCPVCGRTEDIHVHTMLGEHGIGYCLHCGTNIYTDKDSNVYRTVDSASGYYVMVDVIAKKATTWKSTVQSE